MHSPEVTRIACFLPLYTVGEPPARQAVQQTEKTERAHGEPSRQTMKQGNKSGPQILPSFQPQGGVIWLGGRGGSGSDWGRYAYINRRRIEGGLLVLLHKLEKPECQVSVHNNATIDGQDSEKYPRVTKGSQIVHRCLACKVPQKLTRK